MNRGILEAHRTGIVTSATLLANGPGFEEAAALARETPALGVGVHLNLTRGRPVSRPADVPSLVGDGGAFARTPLGLGRGGADLRDVRREWQAQIARVVAAGVTPTHLDSEKHVHLLPALLEVAIGLAGAFGVRALRAGAEPGLLARVAPLNPQWYKGWVVGALGRRARRRVVASGRVAPDRLLGVVDGGCLDGPRLERLLRGLRPGVTELICHPGNDGPDLRRLLGNGGGRYGAAARAAEVRALAAAPLRDRLRRDDISLIHYGML